MAEDAYIYFARVKDLLIDARFTVSFVANDTTYIIYRDGDNTFLKADDTLCKLIFFSVNCYLIAVISDGECKALNGWVSLGHLPKKVTQS